MAKTNFTKVEEALVTGMIKMSIDHLCKLADISKRVGSLVDSVGNLDTLIKWDSQARLERSTLLYILEQDVKLFKDKAIYDKVGISREELKKLINNPKSLTPQDAEKLELIKDKLDTFRTEYFKKHPTATNDDIVKTERKKHINKRFNVNDKWLPLT